VHPKFRYLYFYSLPIVKFWTNTVCYLWFVALCSIVLVQEGSEKYPITPQEVLLFVWIIALAIEELSQLSTSKPREYFVRASNQIDVLLMLLFLVFIVTRIAAHYNHSPSLLQDATIIFVTSTIIAYLRILHVFSFSETLGPLYYVIVSLTQDVILWLIIFVIFCIAFQVAVMVFVSQNGKDPWNSYTVGGTFGVAFFTILGDYDGAWTDLQGSTVGMIVLTVYALIAQIILVNLLIAMMGDTYTSVRGDAVLWRFNRYSLTTEYHAVSPIPPPFNLILLPYSFLQWWLKKDEELDKVARELDIVEGRKLKAELHTVVQALEQEEIRATREATSHEKLEEQLLDISSQQETKFKSVEEKVSATAEISSQQEARFKGLEEKALETQKMLLEILQRLDQPKTSF